MIIGVIGEGSCTPETTEMAEQAGRDLAQNGSALKNNIPVIGLNTWRLSKDGEVSGAIIPAETAAEAVKKALAAASQTCGALQKSAPVHFNNKET